MKYDSLLFGYLLMDSVKSFVLSNFFVVCDIKDVPLLNLKISKIEEEVCMVEWSDLEKVPMTCS